MAAKTITQFYSDLSGDEIDGDNPSVTFTFDGASYEIDLSASEKKEFESTIARYVKVARPATGSRRSKGLSGGPEPKVIRAWAIENGHEVPTRGRIPSGIIEKYNSAHR